MYFIFRNVIQTRDFIATVLSVYVHKVQFWLGLYLLQGKTSLHCNDLFATKWDYEVFD